MPDRIVRHWYRATCFESVIAPWRDSLKEARRDLVARKLGAYDEWGCFFIIVPGGLLRDSAWVDFDDRDMPSGPSIGQPRGLPQHSSDNRKRNLPAYRNRLVGRVR
jgi:hypothetical protein